MRLPVRIADGVVPTGVQWRGSPNGSPRQVVSGISIYPTVTNPTCRSIPTAPSVRLEDVYLDLRSWWPLVRPHGILAGHDYSGYDAGVVAAVNEFVSEKKLEQLGVQ